MSRLPIADCRSWMRAPAIFILALALALLTTPLVVEAQQPGKVYRIGYLALSTGGHATNPQQCPIKGPPSWQALVEGLRERGYVQGQNLVIECRYTEGRAERAPALAAELVSLKPDLLVANTTANVRAAKQATSTIPILMLGVIDPVGRGLVPNLAHPGGNVTGLTDHLLEMEGKRLQLLKEAVPTVSHVAVLSHPGSGGMPESIFERDRQTAAQALGLTLRTYDVRAPEEFAGAFAAMTKVRAEALYVPAEPFWDGRIERIVDLAAQSRLAAVYPWRSFVQAGGLMAYDVNRPDNFRRLSIYVDKIFHGANPGDLPVEQPTKIDLFINLKAAKVLGLTIPSSLLMRAAEVIQ